MACFSVLFLQAAFKGVYFRRKLDALEASFVFNLGVLSVVSCLIQYKNSPNYRNWTLIAISVSMSVALLELLGILIYRCYVSFKGSAAQRLCRTSRSQILISNHRTPRHLGYRSLETSARRRHPTSGCISQTEVTVSSEASSLESDIGSSDTRLKTPPYILPSPQERPAATANFHFYITH